KSGMPWIGKLVGIDAQFESRVRSERIPLPSVARRRARPEFGRSSRLDQGPAVPAEKGRSPAPANSLATSTNGRRGCDASFLGLYQWSAHRRAEQAQGESAAPLGARAPRFA